MSVTVRMKIIARWHNVAYIIKESHETQLIMSTLTPYHDNHDATGSDSEDGDDHICQEECGLSRQFKSECHESGEEKA